MKIAISTISISPHVLAFWRRFTKYFPDAVYYYHTDKHDVERTRFGWSDDMEGMSCKVTPENQHELLEVPILIETMRDINLISRRLHHGRWTLYSSERWFKPPWGMLRLLHPRFLKMAYTFVKLLRHPRCYYLANGIHAAQDMARLVGLFNGDIRCLFWSPRFSAPRNPCARMNGFEKILLWGYFVEPSTCPIVRKWHFPRRILWVGRMVNLKRIITIIEAVKRMKDFSLTVIGEGPEERRLKKAARGFPNITFHKFKSSDEVRQMMRSHDIYVLSSDGREGWGATVNEALEEGMCVLGTYEAGGSATILPDSKLYRAGNVEELCHLLHSDQQLNPEIGRWRVDCAVTSLSQFIKKHMGD